jgi:hypothetical protein
MATNTKAIIDAKFLSVCDRSSRMVCGRRPRKIGACSDIMEVRCSLDRVAKVEHRATWKIPRKSIFRPLFRCVAFRRHYGGLGPPAVVEASGMAAL